MIHSVHSTSRAPPMTAHEISVADRLLHVLTPLTIEQRTRVVAMLRSRFDMARRRANRFRSRLDRVIARAEKTGKIVCSVTALPDGGIKLDFDSHKSLEASPLDKWIRKKNARQT